MKSIDILIIYELIQRELENVLLIKKELEERGYQVELAKYPFHNKKLLKKKYYNNVKMVVTQSMYNNDTFFKLVYNIAGPVDRVLNLQWEQVGTVESEKDKNNYRYPKGIAMDVAHICWGDIPKKNLLNAGISEKKLFQTGPVHMDFFNKRFDAYYKSRDVLFSEYNIDLNSNIVLFISSFSYSDLSKNAVKNLSNKIGTGSVNEFQMISSDSQKAFLEWVEKYLSETEKTTFIYRPHPAESESALLKRLDQKFENFRIINDYSVKQWIKTVDRVISWYSTSIAEAYFANKSYFIVRPLKIPIHREVSILVDSDKITNYENFKAVLTCDINPNQTNDIIKKYYDVDLEYASYKKVADVIQTISSNDEYKIRFKGYDFINLKLKAFKEYFFNKLLGIYFLMLKMLIIIEKRTNFRIVRFGLDKRISNYKKFVNRNSNKDKTFVRESEEKLNYIFMDTKI